MPLANFTLSGQETRLIQHADTVFKLKLQFIKNDSVHSSLKQVLFQDIHEQIETCIKAILHKMESNPNRIAVRIETSDLMIDMSSKPWAISKKIQFIRKGKLLNACPLILIMKLNLKDGVSLSEVTSSPKTSKSFDGTRLNAQHTPRNKSIVCDTDSKYKQLDRKRKAFDMECAEPTKVKQVRSKESMAQNVSSKKTDQPMAPNVLSYKTDRDYIKRENLAEEMKLQHLASPSLNQTLTPQKHQRSSLILNAVDLLVTPVKRFLHW